MKVKLQKIKIPTRKSLEDDFSFISDAILRVNTTIAFQYVIFLVSLLEEYQLPGPVIYSVYKNIILYIASITEGCINFCLKQMIEEGIVENKDIMNWEWKKKINKIICKLKGEKRVCGVLEHKSYKKLTNKTNFLDLNRIAKRAGLFNDALFNDAETIRNKRNKIHLAGLGVIDDMYKKKDIVDTLNSFRNIIEKIKVKLKEIESKPSLKKEEG